MVIWKDIGVLYKEKSVHCRSLKNRKVYSGFGIFEGDVPVCRYNEITKQWEPVVNNRGRAYAARRRLKYRGHKR